MKVNLVVLNYNARDLLEKYLPSIVREAKASRHECRVTVLDNQSSDDSAEFVRGRYPGVNLVVAPENLVLISYNDFARSVDDDVLILLNNDLRLHEGFVDPLVEPFLSAPDVFFTASRGNRAIAKFRWGILEADNAYPGHEEANSRPGYTASAGVAAFDRKKFLELGGYDPIYLPGRYEDVDLCYRGWKRGWKGIYEPKSDQDHEGGTSFERAFKWKKTQEMVFRNSVLFMIKNITDPAILARFALTMPLRLAAAGLQGKGFIWSGFFGALGRLGPALRSRALAKKHFKLSDSAALARIHAKGEVK